MSIGRLSNTYRMQFDGGRMGSTKSEELPFFGFIEKWKSSTPDLGDLRGLHYAPSLTRNGIEDVYRRRFTLEPPGYWEKLRLTIRVQQHGPESWRRSKQSRHGPNGKWRRSLLELCHQKEEESLLPPRLLMPRARCQCSRNASVKEHQRVEKSGVGSRFKMHLGMPCAPGIKKNIHVVFY